MALNYKDQKVAFVSDNAGDSVWTINKVCWAAISTYQLWGAARPLLPKRFSRGWSLAAFEYAVLVLPLLLSLTLFAEHPFVLNSIIYAGLILCRLTSAFKSSPSQAKYSRLNVHANPPSPHSETSKEPVQLFTNGLPEEGREAPAHRAYSYSDMFRKDCVTTWRAHMMVMTVLCILAVDFPVFPRSFGKCETWGTSLMDLGVGSFVFSLGLVYAAPVLKRYSTKAPSPSIFRVVRKSAPVLVLGGIRVLMVKGVDYPEHVTEYGVHWNFFFTLGLMPIFGLLAERVWRKISFGSLAIIKLTIYQGLLILTPLQGRIVDPQRRNLIEQNKEGLASFAGYLAIYYFGVETGLYVLPPDPYFAYRPAIKKTRENPKLGKLMNVIFSYSVVWWTAFGIVHLVLPDQFAVSRRLANAGYVLWVVAFNVSFLLLYLVADHFSVTALVGTSTVPAVFQAINRNGLIVFLIANLLTGLVNVSMKTIFASTTAALLILTAYSVALIFVAWGLRGTRIGL